MKIISIFTNEDKWTQHTGARDSKGCEVSISDKNACCYCLTGAIHKCYPLYEWGDIYSRICKYLNLCDYTTYYMAIVGWNDDKNRKFEEVRQLVVELNL